MENLQDINWINWVFSGIGTEILAILLIGGVVYKIKQRVNQKQTAGKNSKQYQSIELIISDDKNNQKSDTELNQIQKSGDNSEQVQIGRIRNDE